MSDTPKQQIDKLVNQAYNFIKESEKIADKYGESFRFSLTYGAGCSYEGRMTKEDAIALVESGTELTWNQKYAIEKALSDEDDLDEYGEENTGWHASSQSC